ncbi:MAG TPA: nitronate monooxygenase [Streptosporangiaceae bacterium]|nr:nitronate monooxygenase [Streptosporangiaceae bacterium]
MTPYGWQTGDVIGDLAGRPVIVAPMAGGPSSVGLVTAAAAAGAVAFLPAGYKTAQAMRSDIEAVQAATDGRFGVNVFVPGGPAADQDALARYLAAVAGDPALVAPPGEATWDDDDWPAKVADLTRRPVPVVSFTFGCPEPDVVSALRAAGSSVWVTVTEAREAAAAVLAGADCLCVQGSEAGAHRGTFTNQPGSPAGTLELVAAIRTATDVPLVAAGGIMTAADVAAARHAGAAAVQCGTAFLRCPESGAHPVYKAALADPRYTETAVTRAFSGRPARGLVNTFMREHPDAPAAYPEINNATRPVRAAAAAAGDPDRMSLWAGRGYRAATTRPAGEVIEILCERAG